MEIIPGVTHYGDAPVISVDGISSVDLISSNKVRVTYFVAFLGANGEVDKRACLFIDWDSEVWKANRALIDRMMVNHTRERATPASLRN